MLLLYLQPRRTASTAIEISRSLYSSLSQKWQLSQQSESLLQTMNCNQEIMQTPDCHTSDYHTFDRTAQRYFLERRLFL